MPAVGVKTDMGETCFIAGEADEGVQFFCNRCTITFLLYALLLVVIPHVVPAVDTQPDFLYPGITIICKGFPYGGFHFASLHITFADIFARQSWSTNRPSA